MVDADAEEQDGEDEDEENAEPQSISVREIAARVREVVQQEVRSKLAQYSDNAKTLVTA